VKTTPNLLGKGSLLLYRGSSEARGKRCNATGGRGRGKKRKLFITTGGNDLSLLKGGGWWVKGKTSSPQLMGEVEGKRPPFIHYKEERI